MEKHKQHYYKQNIVHYLTEIYELYLIEVDCSIDGFGN